MIAGNGGRDGENGPDRRTQDRRPRHCESGLPYNERRCTSENANEEHADNASAAMKRQHADADGDEKRHGIDCKREDQPAESTRKSAIRPGASSSFRNRTVTLVQMVAAELGITLMPQIAVESELASTRNVVIRPLSPDKPFRTLVLVWRPTTSRGAEFRVLGNLIRECLTGTNRAFAREHDIEALAAR
jgi:DNA-binding transcriptional LysR family regulator